MRIFIGWFAPYEPARAQSKPGDPREGSCREAGGAVAEPGQTTMTKDLTTTTCLHALTDARRGGTRGHRG